jgi:rhodanese-related sulfurtransferase
MGRVRLRTDRRWYEKLHDGQDYDLWVISWLPGQSTGFHDHGISSGAFVIAAGILEEHRPGEKAAILRTGRSRAFGPYYAHDVRNASAAPAVSLHAYSPPLSEMNEFELDGSRLVPRDEPRVPADPAEQDWRLRSDQPIEPPGRQRIEEVLAGARARLRRVSAHDAYEAVAAARAVLVDIRPAAQRVREGGIPEALVIERNVLEWRFDPTCDSRLSVATGYDVQVIVVCSEGYTSSLAAAALQDLGLWRATDVIGGFQAWRAAGLPISPFVVESSEYVG